MVEEAYRVTNEGIERTVNVSRNQNDWEVSEYEEMQQILASQHINSSMDYVIWKLEKRGDFSFSSYYRHLASGADGGFQNFPAKQIWKVKGPESFFFFLGSLQGENSNH